MVHVPFMTAHCLYIRGMILSIELSQCCLLHLLLDEPFLPPAHISSMDAPYRHFYLLPLTLSNSISVLVSSAAISPLVGLSAAASSALALRPVPVPAPASPAHHRHLRVVAVRVVQDAAHARHRHEPEREGLENLLKTQGM